MKRLLFLMLSLLLFAACASTGSKPNQVERITPEELAKLIPPAVATVSLDEIVADSKSGKNAEEIIAKIKNSNSRYELSPTQVLDLHKQGVDAKVLDYIQQSNELAKQNAVAEEINRREQEKAATEKQLQRERALNNTRYYDPFWGPYYGGYYGRGHYWPGYWRGSGFGWGIGYGHRFGW